MSVYRSPTVAFHYIQKSLNFKFPNFLSLSKIFEHLDTSKPLELQQQIVQTASCPRNCPTQ